MHRIKVTIASKHIRHTTDQPWLLTYPSLDCKVVCDMRVARYYRWSCSCTLPRGNTLREAVLIRTHDGPKKHVFPYVYAP